MKLDRSFTAGIRTGDSDVHQAAQGLIGLADGLGLDTVAEGVETEFEAGALLGQGWHLGQGWLFGRPTRARTWWPRLQSPTSSNDVQVALRLDDVSLASGFRAGPAPRRRRGAEPRAVARTRELVAALVEPTVQPWCVQTALYARNDPRLG